MEKSKISSSKIVLFAKNTIKGKEAVLKAWAAKVESKEVTQKLYNSKQRLLSISKSLAEALKLESGEYVKIVAEINGKEFPIFAKVGELEEDGQTFPILVRSGTYNYLGLTPKDYVVISKDISNALIYIKSKTGYYISIRFTSTIDSGFIKAKLGSNSSIGVLKYKKILKLDENKGLKSSSSLEHGYSIRRIKSGDRCQVYGAGPGVYAIDIIRIAPEAYTNAKSLSEIELPIEYDLGKRKVVMKVGNIYLEGSDFEYNDRIKVSKHLRGGLRATIRLNPHGKIKRVIVVDIIADPYSGELIKRHLFMPNTNEPYTKDILHFELEGDEITIEYRYAKEETRGVIMNFDENLKEFVDVSSIYADKSFKEVRDLILSVVKKAKLSRLTNVDEFTKKFEITNLKKEFKYLRARTFEFNGTEKGVLATEIIKEIVIKKLREELEVSKGEEIEVDETGGNRADYWFDIMIRNKVERIIYFVSEVASEWTKEWNPKKLFEGERGSLKDDLENHKNKVVELEEKWSIPNYGYAFAIHVLSDKIEILAKKYKFSKEEKGEWVKW